MSHLGPCTIRLLRQQRQQVNLVGIRGMTSSTPFLVLMMICCISFLESTPGTDKLISVLNRMSMKFRIKASLVTFRGSRPSVSEALNYKGC